MMETIDHCEWGCHETFADLIAGLAALADKWEQDNRRPCDAGDQIQAGIWAATKSDVAELRALLREALRQSIKQAEQEKR